jgi:hypothetical protein
MVQLRGSGAGFTLVRADFTRAARQDGPSGGFELSCVRRKTDSAPALPAAATMLEPCYACVNEALILEEFRNKVVERWPKRRTKEICHGRTDASGWMRLMSWRRGDVRKRERDAKEDESCAKNEGENCNRILTFLSCLRNNIRVSLLDSTAFRCRTCSYE